MAVGSWRRGTELVAVAGEAKQRLRLLTNHEHSGLTMAIPEDCLPHAPEPPGSRIESAAREVCDALEGDWFGRQHGDERAADLLIVCGGLRRFGRNNPTPKNDYRWAVKLMVEVGLLECVEVGQDEEESEDPEEDFFDWGMTKPPPRFLLRSTKQLWTRWRAAAPILGTSVAGHRLHFDESDRSVRLNGRVIATALDEGIFEYLMILVDSYPIPVPYSVILTKVPYLPQNQSQFKAKVDRRLARHLRPLRIERTRSRGHLLKPIAG